MKAVLVSVQLAITPSSQRPRSEYTDPYVSYSCQLRASSDKQWLRNPHLPASYKQTSSFRSGSPWSAPDSLWMSSAMTSGVSEALDTILELPDTRFPAVPRCSLCPTTHLDARAIFGPSRLSHGFSASFLYHFKASPRFLASSRHS
jgi:hypothetical protein